MGIAHQWIAWIHESVDVAHPTRLHRQRGEKNLNGSSLRFRRLPADAADRDLADLAEERGRIPEMLVDLAGMFIGGYLPGELLGLIAGDADKPA